MRGRKLTRSCGNVFEDAGLSRAESESMLVRADLMIQIEKAMNRKHLTQAQAAVLFGVTQPRMSDLVRGKIERFTADALLAMLARAGMTVSFSVRSKGAKPHASQSV